ncbi:MAG: nucleotide exchange factor GrpE [Candidatus Harrisonbacteria bacterium]|nr:nucleotide exchange factor GrpE [Candidatus Harrisonbacteria bacterium]
MDEVVHNQDDFSKELEDLKKKVIELEDKNQEYLNGWKRAKADFVNYQREEAERVEHLGRMMSEGLIRELITVLDSFELALLAITKTADREVVRGVEMIKAQLTEVFKRSGVERIEAKIGEVFNPVLQEAVGVVKTEGPSDTIVEILDSGYRMGEKVIRPARVKVSE